MHDDFFSNEVASTKFGTNLPTNIEILHQIFQYIKRVFGWIFQVSIFWSNWYQKGSCLGISSVIFTDVDKWNLCFCIKFLCSSFVQHSVWVVLVVGGSWNYFQISSLSKLDNGKLQISYCQIAKHSQCWNHDCWFLIEKKNQEWNHRLKPKTMILIGLILIDWLKYKPYTTWTRHDNLS